MRKFENISLEGQRPKGDITSGLAGLYNAYRSMNHDIYDITNNGDSYLLDFSPPFSKPHLLSMCQVNINLVRGLYTKHKLTYTPH